MMGMLNYPRPVVRELLPNVWQARGVTVGTINTMTIVGAAGGGEAPRARWMMSDGVLAGVCTFHTPVFLF